MAEDAYEYVSPISLAPAANLFAPHRYLRKLLGLDPSDTLLADIFAMLAALCDPMTQPEDDERFPLSVDALGLVAVALAYRMLLHRAPRPAAIEAPAPLARPGVGARDALGDERTHGKGLPEVPAALAREGPNKEASREGPDRRAHSPDVGALRFALLLKFFAILEAIHKVLRADDELRVRYLHNEWDAWEKTAHHWLPEIPANTPHDPDACLKVLYYTACVAAMALYKLFAPPRPEAYSPATNPYSEYLLRLWKTHTSIVALALEMDRELEEQAWAARAEYLDTPEPVKKALLGSSALRTVLAWILAQPAPDDAASPLHFDVCCAPLVLFYDPLVRTAPACGSIAHDQQLLVVAAFVLRLRVPLLPVATQLPPLAAAPFPVFDPLDYAFRAARRDSPLGSAGDLMLDLYYRDQFDEDIKYVFGYYESDDEESASASVKSAEPTEPVFEAIAPIGTARRAKKDEIEFDGEGRDWRDCARGENVAFTDRFLALDARARAAGADSDHFFSSWFELEQLFLFLALVKIESVSAFVQRVGQVTLNTVARAISDETLGRAGAAISPDQINVHLTSLAKKELRAVAHEELPALPVDQLTTFDLILFRNPECALALFDELFMCKGLRRLLIWYFTHCVDFLMTVINYVYELVSGLRGNCPLRDAKYAFSRVGPLQLSQVERLMALHELFGTASRFVVDDAETAAARELYTIKLVHCLCLMILRLLLNGVIRVDSEDSLEDYSHDIQVLLFPWIGQVTEARELFFKIKQDQSRWLEPNDALAAAKAVGVPRAAQSAGALDIVAVIDRLEKLFDTEYENAVEEHTVQLTFREFGQRLFYHICRIYKVENLDLTPFETVSSAQEDFYIFLMKFNEFARNKTFVRNIFSLLEGISVGDRFGAKEDEEAELLTVRTEHEGELSPSDTEPVDSEFNDAFLNGEGQFQEGEHGKLDDKKKKKTKKKKRRGKR